MQTNLTLTLETPFLPGSADPNKVDSDWPLRPSEVKGIWRWWARALVAGALFDVGLLHGTNDTNKPYVKIPTRNEAMCISRMVGDVLGLGYAGSRQSRASCFRIFINPDTTTVSSTDEVYKYSNLLQRIKLLALGKRKFEIVSKASIELVIEDRVGCDLSKERMELGMRALALAFKLSCFGKGGRRGLGCFSVSAQGDYADLFNKPIEDLIKESIEAIRKITKETQQCENLWRKNINECELPPMPALSTGMNYVKCIDRKLKNIQDKLLSYKLRLTPYLLFRVQGRNLLNTLHNFFLRSTRARTLKGYGSAKDDLRANFKAWVLGLPREQKGTGYMLKDVNISRRASPIIVAVHEKEAYISIFTSADWPSKLTWKGLGKPIEKPINEIEIIDAMAIAINELTEYLNKQSMGWSSWP